MAATRPQADPPKYSGMLLPFLPKNDTRNSGDKSKVFGLFPRPSALAGDRITETRVENPVLSTENAVSFFGAYVRGGYFDGQN